MLDVLLLLRRNRVLSRFRMFRPRGVQAATMLMIAFMLPTMAAAQHNDRQHIRRGNRLFADTLYTKAQVEYQKATEANSRNPEALYNLGTAMLAQGQPKEAMKHYEQAAALQTNKHRAAQIYHNMGVIMQSQKQFGPAIECYKNALRRNPLDDETRYNLALCQHQLKNQPQDDQQNDKDDQQGEDKQQQDQQQQEQQQQQQQQQDQQQQEQEQPKMSRENAEQLLKAAMQEERQTQDKVQRAQQKPMRRQLEKQW